MGRPAKGAADAPDLLAAAAAAHDPLADLRGSGDPEGRHPGQTPDAADADAAFDPDLRRVLSEAVGEASTCWVGGTGDAEFDSERAVTIVNRLVDFLDRLVNAPDLVAPVDVDIAVDRLHGDEVAVGFLHKSFPCGCRYLSELILNGD